jgi:hypothetical protein
MKEYAETNDSDRKPRTITADASHQKIKLSCPHYHAYLADTSLLIYSEHSENVYGFDRENAALFLHVDSMLPHSKFADIKKTFPELPVSNLESYYALASEIEPEGESHYAAPLNLGIYTPDMKPRTQYRVLETCFALYIPDTALRASIEPLLEPIRSSESYDGIPINVDFVNTAGKWQIYFNDQTIIYPLETDAVFPVLQEYMHFAATDQLPYLISMHAAVVGCDAQTLIFPASSGSGKSTLATALWNAGCQLYSDEMATLYSDGTVTAYPFPVSIKEGSFDIVGDLFENFHQLQTHRRFDGQRLRFLPKQTPSGPPQTASMLFFPKYRKDHDTIIKRLSPAESLMHIKNAGYKVREPLSMNSFEQILETLVLLPAYTIEYSDLESAITEIRRLCQNA